MINYKILPNSVFQFATMPQSTYDALEHVHKHSWVILPTVDHMSLEGIEFFKSRGVVFHDSVTCWKCSVNTIGPTHIDANSLIGINFVMKGSGKMEWMHSSVPPVMATNKLTTGQTVTAPTFPNLDALSVHDTWDSSEGECAIVRVHTPHRIRTTDVARYCLSFRIHMDHRTETYDELIQHF